MKGKSSYTEFSLPSYSSICLFFQQNIHMADGPHEKGLREILREKEIN